MSQIVQCVTIVGALLLFTATPGWSQQQSGPGLRELPTETPLYRITFKEGDPIKGVGSVPAMDLPFQCAGDGTVFMMTTQPHAPDAPPPKDIWNLNPELLISVSPSGEAHSFPLNRVTDLYEMHRVSHTSSDSKVVFLVNAAPEDKPEKARDADAGESRQERAKAQAERHNYLVIFDRDGNYQKKIELDSTFHIAQIVLFSSGAFLVYGHDEADDSPKMAVLKDDGSLLKLVEIPKGDVPESARHPKDARGKAFWPKNVFVPQGDFIYFLQGDSDYPLLRVSVAGAVEAIKPKLPAGSRIAMLIPSDQNLYLLIHTADEPDKHDESILEINPQDGSVLRQLRVGKDESAYGVACVHDQKFLMFHGYGQLVQLVGTAEPASAVQHAGAPITKPAPSSQ